MLSDRVANRRVVMGRPFVAGLGASEASGHHGEQLSPDSGDLRCRASWRISSRSRPSASISAEITSPGFPGERLVACRNPVLAEERARKREDLLAATEKLLAPIAARVAAASLTGADAIGVAVGKVIGQAPDGQALRGHHYR
jgi:hypothetical protein